MIDLAAVLKELHHRVPLNLELCSDLEWWNLFLEVWNGVSLLSGVTRAPPTATVTSDASGGWGCGVFNSSGEWFQFQWPSSWGGVHITIKELLPIVVACAVWGKQWQGKTIWCLCDNVAILRSGTSKHPLTMHLMQCLSFYSGLLSINSHFRASARSAEHCSRSPF